MEKLFTLCLYVSKQVRFPCLFLTEGIIQHPPLLANGDQLKNHCSLLSLHLMDEFWPKYFCTEIVGFVHLLSCWNILFLEQAKSSLNNMRIPSGMYNVVYHREEKWTTYFTLYKFLFLKAMFLLIAFNHAVKN